MKNNIRLQSDILLGKRDKDTLGGIWDVKQRIRKRD